MPGPFENRLDNPAIRRRRKLAEAKANRERAFSSPPSRTVNDVVNPVSVEGAASIAGAYASRGLQKGIASNIGQALLGPVAGPVAKFLVPENNKPIRDMTTRERKAETYNALELAPVVGDAAAIARSMEDIEREGVNPRTLGRAGLDIGLGIINPVGGAGPIKRGFGALSDNIPRFTRREDTTVDPVTGDVFDIPRGERLSEAQEAAFSASAVDIPTPPKNIKEAIDQLETFAATGTPRRGGKRAEKAQETPSYEFTIETEDDIETVKKAVFGSTNISEQEAAFIQPGIVVRITQGKEPWRVAQQANDVLFARSLKRIKDNSTVKFTNGKKIVEGSALDLLGVKKKIADSDKFTEDEAYQLVQEMKGNLGVRDVQVDFIPYPDARDPKFGRQNITYGVEHWDHTVSPTDYGNYISLRAQEIIDSHRGSLAKAKKSPEWRALRKEAQQGYNTVMNKKNLSPVPGSTNVSIGGGFRGTTGGDVSPIVSTPVFERMSHFASPYASRFRSEIGPHLQATGFIGSDFQKYLSSTTEEAKSRAQNRVQQFLANPYRQ